MVEDEERIVTGSLVPIGAAEVALIPARGDLPVGHPLYGKHVVSGVVSGCCDVEATQTGLTTTEVDDALLGSRSDVPRR